MSIVQESLKLEDRLIDFSVLAIKFCKNLPKSYVSYHLGCQLIRSTSSPALNYGEACSSEYRKDFIHKMRICLKELKESKNCLKIISKTESSEDDKDLIALFKECQELIMIFSKSISTASRK
jgi:four helix bundle protein